MNPSKIKNVIVWGNHSETLYPDVKYGDVEGHELASMIYNDKWLDTDFLNTVT
jgi:malate dehydrogenase